MLRSSLRAAPPPLQWATLLAASVVCVSAFELMRLPAALLLGAGLLEDLVRATATSFSPGIR